MDCSLPGSSAHGILQVRILERVAISFSRGSSLSGDAYVYMCVCVLYAHYLCYIFYIFFFHLTSCGVCHIFAHGRSLTLLSFFFTQSMKLQGNQNHTDSSRKRTEWVRGSIWISAPSKLLPLAASSLLLSVLGPLLYQGITKGQTCMLLGLLLL